MQLTLFTTTTINRYLLRPPKNFDSLVKETEQSFEKRFPSKDVKGTCFTLKQNDSFDSLLLSRKRKDELTPLQVATTKLASLDDNDTGVQIVIVKGSAEIKYASSDVTTTIKANSAEHNDSARLSAGTEFSIRNPSTKNALTLFCLAHKSSFGGIDANLEFLSAEGWGTLYPANSIELRRAWSLKRVLSGDWELGL